MNPIIVYDTETSGLSLFKEPSEHPGQPHIVQLGALLYDLDAGKRIATLDVIVRPDGWTIPHDVAAVHGITTEHAMDVGIPEPIVLDMLLELWGAARPERRLRLAHNEQFDARIVRIALKRFRDTPMATAIGQPQPSDVWKDGKAACTQLMATPIMKLPPTPKMRAAGRFHHKSANLTEAYKHFTGQDLQNAHSAMADVDACLAVYLAITAAAEAVPA